jgi:aminopeptidase-like protein
MENTCNFQECLVVKKFKCKKAEECPNYIESWWTPYDTNEPKLVQDCINRRLFLMIQDLYNRMDGLHKSQDNMRVQNESVNAIAAKVMSSYQKRLESNDEDILTIGE